MEDVVEVVKFFHCVVHKLA